VAVMAFHYTFKYDELYHFSGNVPFQVPWGYLGVDLFFVISGFVIFMTLDRTRVPLDFVVSRVSRLFPAYWAAIIITVLLTDWLGLPGKEVSWYVAFLNFTMVQHLFSIPLVDAAYWTLLVELLFYALAFLLFITKSMHRVLPALAAMLMLRLVYWACAEFAHVDLPWRISQLLILDYIPFFALGIVAFRQLREPTGVDLANILTGCLAILVLGVTDSLLTACVGVVCFLAVWFAASGRLPFLRFGIFVWLGTISYPLYLLHENIGWAILRQLQVHGWTPTQSLAMTTALVLALATALCYAVERPAMAAIRGKYKLSRSYRTSHAAP